MRTDHGDGWVGGRVDDWIAKLMDGGTEGWRDGGVKGWRKLEMDGRILRSGQVESRMDSACVPSLKVVNICCC